MNKSTKILAGLSTALILGGAGTATYFGIETNRLKDEHAQYVIAQEKRNEDLTSKIVDLQEALGDQEALKQELALAKASSTANADRISELTAQLDAKDAEIARLNAEILKLKYKEDSTYTYLSFTFNEIAKTASVKGNDTSITSVEIPAKVIHNDEVYDVTAIGANAFNNYTALISITIPSSIMTIGECAFEGCTSTSVIFENTTGWEAEDMSGSKSTISSSALSSENVLTTLSKYKFCTWTRNDYPCLTFVYDKNAKTASVKSNDSTITNVEIPSQIVYKDEIYTVTSIAQSAFSNCTELASITIPASIKSIGKYAFQMCHSLKSITIPASVTSIGSDTFFDCSFDSVIFENPNNWKVQSGDDPEIELAAESLTGDNTLQTFDMYKLYTWTRTDTSSEFPRHEV